MCRRPCTRGRDGKGERRREHGTRQASPIARNEEHVAELGRRRDNVGQRIADGDEAQ